jgi:hypothetical protein
MKKCSNVKVKFHLICSTLVDVLKTESLFAKFFEKVFDFEKEF